QNLDQAAINRIARFVRLARALGWTFSDLDRLVSALGLPDLDDDAVLALDAARRVEVRLAIPLVRLASWWTSIETRRIDHGSPLYDQLFLNKTVSPSGDTTLQPNAAPTEP